ncbi:MAG: SRPBCC domain-containing protein [Balneolales bacterium]
MKNVNKTHIETTKREFILERVFNAPRELVFEAYSDCSHLKHWWGPREWPLTVCEMDFRVGGIWHYCMSGPDGQESWGKAIYHDIKEPDKIVYDDFFSDKEGNISDSMPEIKITVEFIDHDGKTKIRSKSIFKTEAELKKVIEMGMAEGITETYDRLDEHLSQYESGVKK